MYRIVKGDKPVGRSYKSLTAAENAVERQYGKSIDSGGTGRIDIVDEDTGQILRVFYVK